MSAHVLNGTPEFIISDLRRNQHRFFTLALLVACLIHLSGIGVYWGSVYFNKDEPIGGFPRSLVNYREIGPSPSIGGPSPVVPNVSTAGPTVKPNQGLPVPVPETEVDPERKFATQQEMNPIIGSIGNDSGDGRVHIIEDFSIPEDETPPEKFIPFEKPPAIVSRALPVYPEIARRVNLEGIVVANLWIDKRGKVRDVKIIKSDSEIFNQAVIDAAKQTLFTPAMMNNGPVSVWMAMTFTFQLR
jgi:TonB family protein